tara:strand:- start:281 stop:448 length:168 start_codon:yes stop_codon:yes gene_type:complete
VRIVVGITTINAKNKIINLAVLHCHISQKGLLLKKIVWGTENFRRNKCNKKKIIK